MAIQNWIAMRSDLAGDPAVIRISDKLQVRTETVVGYLHAVWSWIDENSDDGKIHGCQLEAIEQHLCLPNVMKLMQEVGWLEYENETLTVPHWDRWFIQSAKKRLKKTKQQRKRRRSQVEAKLKPSNGFTCSNSNSNSSSTSSSTESTSSSTDPTKDRMAMSVQFKRFWQKYPRKEQKAKAESLYPKHVKLLSMEDPECDPHDTLYRACCAYAASDRVAEGYKLLPATWFNQRRYLDDPAEWQDSTKSKEPEREYRKLT